MTIGSILLGLALLGLVGLFIARPLLKPGKQSISIVTKRGELLARKQNVLAEIKSLDFDYDTGKIPKSEHDEKRDQLMAEATVILKELDAFDEGEPLIEPALGEPSPQGDMDAEIEKAIAALRAAPGQATPLSPEPSAPMTAGAQNGKPMFCSQCGGKLDSGDKFCAYCGHKIKTPQPA